MVRRYTRYGTFLWILTSMRTNESPYKRSLLFSLSPIIRLFIAQHIISNAEYYGPSLFLLATDVVNGYIFQEPSLLSSLQNSGLTDVVLHALLVKDVSGYVRVHICVFLRARKRYHDRIGR